MTRESIRTVVSLAALAAAAAPAPPTLAQPSNIDPASKYCWGENIGFLNWRDGNGAAQGVRIHATYLSGYIWCENAGWIKLGTTTNPPGTASCLQYPSRAAQTGDTFGVNIDGGGGASAVGLLTGYAWGENIGWINFSGGALASPPNPARFDRAARRLRGYAWGENVGWINLDNASVFVGTTLCQVDADENGLIQPADIALFVNIWFCGLQNGTIAGDFDGNGVVEPADISLFVNRWFTALTTGAC